MRLDNRIILITIVALTLCMIPSALYTTGALRIVLSFLCMLFFPGYALLSVFFPRMGDIGVLERIVLSLGASLAIVAGIGFALHFTPWGIKLMPILISVGASIVVMSIGGVIRQQLLPGELRFNAVLRCDWDGWQEMARWKKIITIVGMVAAISVVGVVLYYAVALPVKQVPTEFYILNSEGKAADYPRQTKLREPFVINVVVINHESLSTDFKVRVMAGENLINEVDTNSLTPEEKWSRNVSVMLKDAGKDQKVDFYLYKDGASEPYFKDPLYLYIDAD